MAISMAAAAGMGMQAGGSILGGFMQASQKKDEASAYKYNAAVLFQRAKAMRMLTKFRQMRQAEAAARTQGELEAGIGGSGIVSTEGAPLLALALQKSESNLQNYLIGYEGMQRAKEIESEALAYWKAAKRAKKGARLSILGGFLGAGGSVGQTLLSLPPRSGATSYSSYSAMQSSTGTGLYAGTGGGYATGGYSRSMRM
jgi:hypothetical protein